jgi:hypothetical protein
MSSKTTTDLDEIRGWAESKGGKPACILGTGRKGSESGMLRLMFPDAPYAQDEKLHEMSWDDWGKAFEANDLALVYEPGSLFNKIIARSTAAARGGGQAGASVHHPHGR